MAQDGGEQDVLGLSSPTSARQGGCWAMLHRRRILLATVCLPVFAVIDILSSLALASNGSSTHLYLLGLRAFMFLAGPVLAIQCGSGAWTCSDALCCCCRDTRAADSVREVSLSVPLAEHPSADVGSSQQSSSALVSDTSSDVDLQSMRQSYARMEANKWKKLLVLAVSFLAMTAQSIYIGTLVLSPGTFSLVEQCSIVLVILAMNIEFISVKSIVDAMTDEEGMQLPGLHEHPLTFLEERKFMRCGVCRERVGPSTGGYFAFQCKQCDFIVCLNCYRKQQRKSNVEEGILRGDKGPKPMQDMTAWQYFRRTMKLMWPFRWLLLTALSCVLAAQLLAVMTPNYRGDIVNALIEQDKDAFTHSTTLLLVFSILASQFQAIQNLGSSMVQRRIIYDTSVVMFKSLVRQDIVFFDGTMTGQLTSRMTNDLQTVVQPVQAFINQFLASLYRFSGALAMCLLTSWRLTVLAATLIGPVLYLTQLYAKWSKTLNTRIRANLDDANAIATESLRNIRTVRAFGANVVERLKFRHFIDAAMTAGTKDAVAGAGLDAITQYMGFAATILIIWYGGRAVLHGKPGSGGLFGEITVGRLVTYNLYWDMLNKSIQGMSGLLNSLIKAASAAQRVFDIIDLEPDICIDGGSPVPLEQPLAVEFSDVHFTYQMRPDKKVLSGVNFSIDPGTTVAFVGKSGAGKSTLVNLILRFYDPQEGHILVNKKPLPEWCLREHHRRVGVVTQETQVFCRPIHDNLIYGLPPDQISDDMVISAAQQANAHTFISEMELGYKSMIGEGGSRLSGGQRQRLAIARAFLRRPTLLLLDEATSALDAESEGLVQEALEKMVRSMIGKCSVLLIAHRLSTVISSDKIVVMEGGRDVEQGPHDELLQKNGAYATLVSAQLSAAANVISEDVPPEDDHPPASGKGKKGKGKGKRRSGSPSTGDGGADKKGGLLLPQDAATPASSQCTLATSPGGINSAEPVAPAPGSCRACLKHWRLAVILALVVLCDMAASLAVGLDHAVYLALCGIRVLLTLGGLFFGVQLGLGTVFCSSEAGGSETCESDAGVALQPRFQAGSDSRATPLLASTLTASTSASVYSTSEESTATTNGHAANASSPSIDGMSTKLVDAKLRRLEQSADLKQKNKWKRNLVLVLVAAQMTAQSIFCAAHVLSAGAVQHWEAACLIVIIITMNAEFVAMKNIVEKMTEDEGVLVKGLHPHPLIFESKAVMRWCKVCRERIGVRTGGQQGFTCYTCGNNFNCCLQCYRKQQAKVNSEEGLLRSDKGPRPPLELSTLGCVVRVVRLIWPFRCVAATAVISVFITQFGQVLIPDFRGNLFDELIQKDEATFYRDLKLLVVISVLTSLVRIVQSFSTQLTQRSVSYTTRAIMFESLLRQDVALFDGTTTGSLTSRMTNDVSALVQPVYQLLNNVWANLVRLIGGTFMCFRTSWELTVLCSTLVLPVIYTTRVYALWAKNLYLTIRIAMADANSTATESLRNIRVVRAFAADQVEIGEYSRFINSAARGALKDAWAQAGVQALNGYLTFASMVVIMWFGGLQILHDSEEGRPGGLSVGQLVKYGLYWDMMQQAIQDINSNLNMLIRAASASQRVFEILELEPDIAQEHGDTIPPGALSVAFVDVKFTYQMRPDRQVLKGLSFEIPPGKTVAVVGRSGAGKSTLVSLILRFYDPQEGQVTLNGRSLTTWRLVDYVRRVGVVAQDTQVFCRPIIDNLLYGLADGEVAEPEIIAAAQKANAHEFISELDQGYRSHVGEGGVRLSGGQKQRLAIARALLRHPSLLLLDEATSALDAVNEALVQEALETMVQAMAGTCSVMLIAHRLSTVKKCDNIVVMDAGKVVESGKHDDLLSNAGVYAQLVQRQIAAHANTIAE